MNEYRKREEQDLRIFLSYKNPYTKEISPNLDEKIKFYIKGNQMLELC